MTPPARHSRVGGNLQGGVWLCCLAVTLNFDSSPIKGEGVFVVVLSCCQPGHRTSGLRVKVRDDVWCPAVPALWIPAYAGMTVKGAGYDGVGVKNTTDSLLRVVGLSRMFKGKGLFW